MGLSTGSSLCREGIDGLKEKPLNWRVLKNKENNNKNNGGPQSALNGGPQPSIKIMVALILPRGDELGTRSMVVQKQNKNTIIFHSILKETQIQFMHKEIFFSDSFRIENNLQFSF